MSPQRLHKRFHIYWWKRNWHKRASILLKRYRYTRKTCWNTCLSWLVLKLLIFFQIMVRLRIIGIRLRTIAKSPILVVKGNYIGLFTNAEAQCPNSCGTIKILFLSMVVGADHRSKKLNPFTVMSLLLRNILQQSIIQQSNKVTFRWKNTKG